MNQNRRQIEIGGASLLKRRTGGRVLHASNGEPAGGVAEAIYFLAGERAAFITGQVLSVNGGMVIG